MIFLKRRALMTRFNFNYKTASGVGSLVLEKCAETFFKQFKLLGNSVQETTTGKNLFDVSKIDTTRHILGDLSDFSDLDIKNYNLSNLITVKENEKIIKSGNTGSSVAAFLRSDKSFLKGIKLKDGITATVPVDAYYFCCNIAVANIRNNIQIEKGEIATPYEQYTGGKPSPSPEFPQEIKNVGKYNSDIGKYEVDVQVTGKNLFNGKYEIGSLDGSNGKIYQSATKFATTDFIKVIPNNNYCYNGGTYREKKSVNTMKIKNF